MAFSRSIVCLIVVTLLSIGIVAPAVTAGDAPPSPTIDQGSVQSQVATCQNASATLTKPDQTAATFFYPWYGDEAHWSDQGHSPPDTWYANYTPDLVPGFDPGVELYNSSNRSVKRWQFEKMRRANIEVAISSWWGQGSPTDERFDTIIDEIMPGTTNPHRNLQWALYYEKEGPGYNGFDNYDDPPVDEIVDDIEYIKANYADSPYYYTINGSPVVYVYGELTDDGDLQAGENTTYPERWRRVKNQTDVHVVLKVNGDMAATEPGIDGWHQYAPANRWGTQPTSGYVSPGFTKPHPEGAPFLKRNATEYETAITDLVDTGLSHLLVQTWNEYHEGTQIEPAQRVHHDDSGTFTARNASYNDTFVDITGDAFADVVPTGITADFADGTALTNESTVPLTIEAASPYDASYRAYLSVDGGQFRALGCDGTTADGDGRFETNRTLSDGTHTLTTYVRDADDDTSTDSRRTVTVDTTAPETTLATNRSLSDGWTNGSVEIALDATDATTNVTETLVSVDGQAYSTYSGPITLSANGTHTISYYSTDELQNAESVTNATVGIDREAPAIATVTASQRTDLEPGEAFDLTVDASDETSGVGTVDVGSTPLRRSGGNWTATLQAPDTTGNHTMPITAFDRAGNAVSESLTVSVTEDDGGGGGPALPPPPDPEPALSIASVDLDAAELEVGESVAVSVTVANDGDATGERTLELALDGEVVATAAVSVPAGETVEATLSHTVDEPGEYEVAVGADVVGTVTVAEPAPDDGGDGTGRDGADGTDEVGDGGPGANESTSSVDPGDGSTDDESAADATAGGDGVPGFSPVAALVALVLTSALARRR
ncbi:OmpL47-type beta-barrel domain-containing protein [Halovivax limisalsi]|uniref:OmpL47-type beta-barrel domain-containing protein n=1 Tax=Halovivax limisalsi TaxID=1453760 RepID=UPI001FFCF2E9|nr:CARDB domain-containing protein [Halovivax limisalsi]